MNYTKGEWKAKRNPCDWVILVDDTDDTVADVYSCFTGTAEANSYLISAAPDMYEALQDIRDGVVNNQERLGSGRYSKLMAAIKKAEGK